MAAATSDYRRGRIYVFHEDGWQIGDERTGMCLCLDSKTQAQECARFARAYIRRHGDINLGQFPFSLDTPLHPFCECGNSLPCWLHSAAEQEANQDAISSDE